MCGSRDSSCLMSVYWIWRLYTLLFPFIYITRSSVELCYDLHVCMTKGLRSDPNHYERNLSKGSY